MPVPQSRTQAEWVVLVVLAQLTAQAAQVVRVPKAVQVLPVVSAAQVVRVVSAALEAQAVPVA